MTQKSKGLLLQLSWGAEAWESEAWGAGVPPTPLTIWVWMIKEVGPVQTQLMEVLPGTFSLGLQTIFLTGLIRSTDLCSEAPPTRGSAQIRLRPREAPPTQGSAPAPLLRVWGPQASSSSSSLERGPGIPRPRPRHALAPLESPVLSSPVPASRHR